ncbi:MAG: SdrD B-like domain-containing protein [Bacteroidota bacterium]|nr:SdrD B-like domain-containing protein [Bacteroidota bacterium]
MKFNDKNKDGIKAGDVGLSGWKIKISGPIVDSILTDANGNFSFINLPQGEYTITEELKSGWEQTYPTNPNSHTITIDVGGTIINDIDFGNYKLGIIAGKKFNDINGNGQIDNGEPGLPNWKIKLSGSKTDSLLTDSNGNFSFNNLQPGTYELSEDLQFGWMQTYPGEPFTHSITFDSSGFVSDSVLFGNFKLPTISGYKFNDINGNGTKDTNEPVLEGWQIKLSGERIDSILTDATGYYEFLGLTPGKYLIREVQQNGWVQSSANPDSIEVTSAGSINNINFGNFKLMSISGQKYHDLNGNGFKDSGENGLSDWKIAINGPVVDTVLTDENGNYSFTDLGPGTYTLSEVPKSGWLQTSTSPAAINVMSGEDVPNINFGNFTSASISGYKFEDQNGNGTQDNGEQGLPNWTIYLNGTKIDSAQTDGTGKYTFGGLSPGTYTVSEKQVAGWHQTAPPPPGTYSVDINQSGLVIEGKDFGNYQSKSIGGRKFQDVNGDGIENENEHGLDGWIIVLQGPTGTQKDTTDIYGSYRFAGLPDGNYTIIEENQYGWIQTLPPQTNPSHQVTLTGGQSITGKNFGNFSIGIVQGIVFEDLNGNGIKNPEDVIVEGRTIQLIRGGSIVASRTTDSEGKYKFIAVDPGLYSVKLLPATGWLTTSPNGAGEYFDTMTVGGFHRFKDFGTFKLAVLGGLKFRDINGNGIKEAGEDGLANWKIYFNGPKSDSTLTDINGNYRFTNLNSGTYDITEALKQHWVQTSPQSGKHTVVVYSGMDSTGFDFGNFEKASISGVVYFDKNADGIRSPGDDYQNNWKVILRRSSDGKIDTTRTSVNGVYGFGGLTPDSFTVSIEYKTGWLTIAPSSGIYGVKVQSGQQVNNLDFGAYKDSTLFRTFLQTDLVQKSVNLKKRRPPVLMPTAGNVLDSTFKRMGWKTSGLSLGIPRTDSAKYYGWVTIKNPFFPAFFRSYIFPHTGPARGFDTYDGKPFKGRKGMFFRRQHDNHLAGELLALKVNLAASDVNITPSGLGNLLFVDPTRTNNPLNGKTIRQIISHIDTVLTHYQWFANRPDYFKLLDTALTRINQAFVGTMETLKTSPLKIRGVRSLEEVPFLRPNPFPLAVATLPMVEAEMDIPEKFTLYQNYPNPFNASTIIQYQLTQTAAVTIKLYNIVGQEVATLVDNEVLEEGMHGLEFNANNIASGVYFYRIVAEGINNEDNESLPERFVDVKKMILLK